MADLTGKSLGRYNILEQLGEGGMATVYKAYDTRLESEVAVKVIRTDNLPQSAVERALRRFEREARSLARLNHPNIVKVIDYGEFEEKPFLVMPYLPGGTLKRRLGQPIPWQQALRTLLPIAQALDFAHREGLVHRDVKPSNILVASDGELMLTDFGIAKVLDIEETVDLLTGTSAAVGTPEYMAPEQATAKNADHRADIYALGIVLYEMVTGRKPYQGDTPMAVLIMHARDPLPRPKRYVPTLPDALESILLRMLAKKPENRYPDMMAVIQAFEGLVAVKTSQKDIKLGPAPSKPKSKLVVWLAAGGVGLGLLCLGGIIVVLNMLGSPSGAVSPPARENTAPGNNLSTEVSAAGMNLIPSDLGDGFELANEQGQEAFPLALDANNRNFRTRDTSTYVTSRVAVFDTTPADNLEDLFAEFSQSAQAAQPNVAIDFGNINPIDIGDRGAAMEYSLQNTTWRGYTIIFIKSNVMVILDEFTALGDVSADQAESRARLIESLIDAPRQPQFIPTAAPISMPTISAGGDSYTRGGFTFSTYEISSGAFTVDLPAFDCSENRYSENEVGILCTTNSENLGMINVLNGVAEITVDETNAESVALQMIENLKPIGLLTTYSNVQYLDVRDGMYAYSFDFVHANLGDGSGRLGIRAENGELFVIQFITFVPEDEQVIWDTAYTTFTTTVK